MWRKILMVSSVFFHIEYAYIFIFRMKKLYVYINIYKVGIEIYLFIYKVGIKNGLNCLLGHKIAIKQQSITNR